MSGNRWFWLLVLSLCLPACGAEAPPEDLERLPELTSKQAVEREITIHGYVYLEKNASSSSIWSAVQRQIRTAFGPLRIGKISVDDRELKNNIDSTTFEAVTLDLVRQGSGAPTVLGQVKRVSYTYKARALADKSLASRSTFSFALLMGTYQSFVSEIIHDCVEDYEHDQEFASSFWYVWAPNVYACKQRIATEAAAIESERQGLTPDQVGETELGRRFLPVTAELKPSGIQKTTYPEYDQLYGIGTAKSRVVVYQLLGLASHDDDPEDERFENDLGFKEYFKLFKVLADGFQGLRVAPASASNPLVFTWNNKVYTATFSELYSWVVSRTSFPPEVTTSERHSFLRAIHDQIILKWITLEVPLVVQSAAGSKAMTLEIRLIYGTDSGWNVKQYFKEAFKKGDVVLYDGHSYIGSGPLDPGNFSSSDFSSAYQILFVNSCVSFNYYGVDYFDLKSGGTQKLDLVTNGLEVYIVDGGKSMAQFIVALFDGSQRTWLSMLEKTQVTMSYWGVHDPSRNVDGELDNTYDPAVTPITVKEGETPPPVTVSNTTAACGGQASGTVPLSATADGAARVEFLVGGTLVAQDSTAPYAASWDSRGVADGSVTLVARAISAAGVTAESSCTLQVKNGGGGGDLFADDMESGAGGWSATGLWHRAASGGCASPAYASPVSSWYFGSDASCTFKQSGATKGTLTSPAIAGISATSRLSFAYLRQVEQSSSGSYDRTVVEVAEAGSSTWKAIWSRDSKTASSLSWQSSGELSLAEWAGRTIQLRFSFDSVDSYANDHVGWMIDDVRLSE